MNEDECKDACEELKIPLGRLRNNAICFKAGNGKCRQQNAKGGDKTSRICKKEGILRICTYYINLRIKYNIYSFFKFSRIKKSLLTKTHLAIDCQWGEWDTGKCSADCGDGIRTKKDRDGA